MKALLSEDEFPHTARIELAPREGILAPAPKPAAKPPEAKPKTALPSGPPIELGAEPPAGGAPEALLLPPLPVPAAPLPEPLSMGDDVAAPAPAPAYPLAQGPAFRRADADPPGRRGVRAAAKAKRQRRL
ncbi:MAG: hypothetical protein NTX64_06295 [Elusimicrobia bacterium]|nr:hypothetical protein [Elusimicrobiota bacterium]